MDAGFVVPGPLDVAGTLSRLHLWGEDPANRFDDGVSRACLRRKWLTTMNAEYVIGPIRQVASGALDPGPGDACPPGDAV